MFTAHSTRQRIVKVLRGRYSAGKYLLRRKVWKNVKLKSVSVHYSVRDILLLNWKPTREFSIFCAVRLVYSELRSRKARIVEMFGKCSSMTIVTREQFLGFNRYTQPHGARTQSWPTKLRLVLKRVNDFYFF